jgi:hypothetical protein
MYQVSKGFRGWSKTSALGNQPLRMLQVIQRFGGHYSCHLQRENLLVGSFLRPYIGKAVGRAMQVPRRKGSIAPTHS